MSEILTTSEIAELTGTESAAHQARVLRQNGIYFVQGTHGQVRTTWHHINNPMGLRPNLAERSEPDWDAMQGV